MAAGRSPGGRRPRPALALHVRSVFLWLTVGCFAAAAAIMILALIADFSGRTWEDWFATSLIAGSFCLLGLVCTIVLDRAVRPIQMSFGAGAAIVACLLWLLPVWISFSWTGGHRTEQSIFKVAGALTLFAAWCVQAGLLDLLRLEAGFARTLRRVSIWTWAVVSAGSVVMFAAEVFEEEPARVLAVFGILAALGTVVTPALAVTEAIARRSRPEDIDERIEVALTCPRCSAQQTLRCGARRCGSCGLRITIQVTEPRCRCGYLLYDLSGTACPECGRDVTNEVWSAGRDDAEG